MSTASGIKELPSLRGGRQADEAISGFLVNLKPNPRLLRLKNGLAMTDKGLTTTYETASSQRSNI